MSRLQQIPLFLLLIGAPFSSAWARYTAVVDNTYNGRHPTEYTQQLNRVRVLVTQTQLEISSRLGLLQYVEGFQYPMTIRFEDEAPAMLENSLAYVRLLSSTDGFRQELVVNLDPLIRASMSFDKVFYHEMTHAVLNDAVGGEASSRIPHWVQEGLAEYISGEGEDRVKQAAAHTSWYSLPKLLWDVDSPLSGAAYPQYYLDIKYILDAGSINALQCFVRDLIDGKSTHDALQERLGMDIGVFQKNVQDYSLKAFQNACDRGPYHDQPCR